MVILPHRRKAFQPTTSSGGGGSTLLTDLWAWYDFEETGAADNAVDASGNGRTLTRVANMTADATGAPDGGACRVGTSNIVAMSRSHENVAYGNSITMSCWIRAVAGQGNGTSLAMDQNASNTFNLAINFRGNPPSGVGRIYVNNASTSPTYTIAADTWYHIVMTYNAATTVANVWWNGVKSANTVSGTPISTAGNLKLQTGGAGQKWTGIAVWTRALSNAEIAELYNGGVNLRYANL